MSRNQNLQNLEFWGKSLLAGEWYYENTSLMWDKPAGDVEDNPENQMESLLP